MIHGPLTAEQIQAALDASEVPPREGFERMVRWGIINRQGRVTKLYGGEGELEPEAIEYLEEKRKLREAEREQKRKKNGRPRS